MNLTNTLTKLERTALKLIAMRMLKSWRTKYAKFVTSFPTLIPPEKSAFLILASTTLKPHRYFCRMVDAKTALPISSPIPTGPPASTKNVIMLSR